uniref:Uncharacterized protein n=1 Tax=Ciona savignyi TaxID=51511 RepID=H2YM47_CIOSA
MERKVAILLVLVLLQVFAQTNAYDRRRISFWWNEKESQIIRDQIMSDLELKFDDIVKSS